MNSIAPPRVLMVGPPNVGKSVLFNRLTGLTAGVSNYPGTTVEFSEGALHLRDGLTVTMVDAPGTYSLDTGNEAERVTTRLLEDEPDLVLSVVDALRPESGLHLALEVMRRGYRVALVINRVDLAEAGGKIVHQQALAGVMSVPVVAASGAKGRGIDLVRNLIADALDGNHEPVREPAEPTWELAEELAAIAVETRSNDPGSPSERNWDEKLTSPWPGIPIALGAVALSLGLIVGLGMGLRQVVLLPLIRDGLIPILARGIESLIPPGLLRAIVIGEYGLMTKGIEWPFTLVLPYVASFYLVLSLLEDSGYFPRLAALLDGVMYRLGLSGAGIMPLLLGYGCGIPAIMATRTLETRRERLTVAGMVCFAVPCIAQTGAFISLLAATSYWILLAVFSISLFALVIAGVLLSRILPGERSGLVMEIPDLLPPSPAVIGSKVWMRIKHYLGDGVLPVMLGVGFASLVYETGAVELFGGVVEPVVTGWLNLPQEAAVPLLLGIFRRELTVLPLLDMDLTSLQLFTGAVVGLFYVPCIAMLSILAREFRPKIALAILLITTSMAIFLGGLLTRLMSPLFS